MSVWQRDPHTNKPTGGDEILCDAASDPPGKLTCEARLSTWNSKHVLLAPAPNSDKKTQTLVVVSSNFFFFSFFFPKIFHHNSLNPCWFQIFFFLFLAVIKFLPGTGGKPSEYGRLLSAAQKAGHFVIGLSYVSQPIPVSAFNAWCLAGIESRSSADCNTRSHKAMLFGLNKTRNKNGVNKTFAVDEGDGLWDVEAHCVEMLLSETLHSVSWGKLFLTDNNQNITWSRIIVSGHSQGAGHAAFWSVHRPLLGVVLFSGPQDTVDDAMSWLRAAAPSPSMFRRALISAHEECGPAPLDGQSFCEADTLMLNLAAMDIRTVSNWTGGGGAQVDGGGGKVVVSFAEPSSTCPNSRKYHCSVAMDACAPLQTTDIFELWVDLFSS